MINRLKKVRKSRGYSQSELAYMCGVTRNTISSLETGQYLPGSKLLLKLEEIFGGAWSFALDEKETSELHQKMYDIYYKHYPDECD